MLAELGFTGNCEAFFCELFRELFQLFLGFEQMPWNIWIIKKIAVPLQRFSE